MLNTALFGMTAAEWRKKNPGRDGNMRDYATIEQLLVLSNLENINALLIGQGKPQSERIEALNTIAKSQLDAIARTNSLMDLKALDTKKAFLTTGGIKLNSIDPLTPLYSRASNASLYRWFTSFCAIPLRAPCGIALFPLQ